MSEESEMIGEGEQIFLLSLLSETQRRQEHFFDTVADSVMLAANQVQDKQLELTKAGPEVEATDVFLDLLISIAMSGPIAGALMKKVTSTVLDRVLRTRLAFFNLPKAANGEKLYAHLFASILRKDQKLNITKDFLKKADLRNLYGELPYQVWEKSGTLLGVGKNVIKKSVVRKPIRVTPKDSPGVMIADIATTFTRRQKTLNQLAIDGIRSIAMSRKLTHDEFEDLVGRIQINLETLPNDVAITKIKEKYKLFFEACIWVQFLPPLNTVYVQGLAKGRPTLKYVSPKLVDYALERFFSPRSGFEYNFLKSHRTRTNAVLELLKYLKLVQIESQSMGSTGMRLIRAAQFR